MHVVYVVLKNVSFLEFEKYEKVQKNFLFNLEKNLAYQNTNFTLFVDR